MRLGRWAAAALLVAAACGGSGAEGPPVLLLSGKDDHGIVAEERVALLDVPEGDPLVLVPDGTLVEVLDQEDEWFEVRALEGERGEGWVNDFYLRGRVHLVGDPPGCDVALTGEPGGAAYATVPASTQAEVLDFHDGWVGVLPLGEDRIGLVPRVWVSELPGPAAEPGVACAELELDREAKPHRH